jgi:RNA polymerase sigma factor (sigma-70 family)
MGPSREEEARRALLERVYKRMRWLTRWQLRSYHRLHQLDLADDVLHEALLRLDKVLTVLHPDSDDHLHGLAAVQVKRACADMARKERLTRRVIEEYRRVKQDKALADLELEPSALSEWTEFHRCVDSLPDDERKVFVLIWYAGLQRSQAAGQLGVSVRTVKRRWRSARRLLAQFLQGWLEE